METVTPLYTNGALGISAVGYTLNSEYDHVPISLLSSHKASDQHTTHPTPLPKDPRDSNSHISSTTNTPSSVSAYFAPPSEYSHSSASRHADVPMHIPRSRKRKEHASSTDFDQAVDAGDHAHMREHHPPRPASRLKRLSSLTLSTFSSVSSPSRLSRSFSFSTKSSSPFFSAHQTTPQPPPNKLVKRSLSQHHSKSRPTTPASFRDRIPTRRSASYNFSSRSHEYTQDSETPFEKPRPTRTFSLSNLISSTPSRRKSSAPRSLSAKLIRRKYAGDSPHAGPGDVASHEGRLSRHGMISPLHCHPVESQGLSEAMPNGPERGRAQFATDSSFADWGYAHPEHMNASLVPEASTQNETDPFLGMTNDFARLSHRSRAPSHTTSTIPGSEHGTRIFSSGDEDDADCRSDTIFDSLRTGITSLSSVGAASRLKSLFEPTDDGQVDFDTTVIPTTATHTDETGRGAAEHVHMRQADQSGSNRESHTSQNMITDGEQSSVMLQFASRKLSDSSGSSASHPRRSLNRDEVPYDADSENDMSSSDDDEMVDSSETRANDATQSAASSPPTGEEQNIDLDHPPSSSSTPHKSGKPRVEFAVRNSLFDWSEQPSVEKGSLTSTPPRPKTVHGKKDTESRGSRSTGRRVPSGVHARSQSVPVVSDASGKRTNVSSKFGTWGVGSKVASEDWDDDFDFGVDDLRESLPAIGEDKRTDSGIAMLVPKAIREQQTNVIANIGLLKEWGLLIEELKELRVKVHSLGLIDKPDMNLFEQVDAMIDLADQEADDEPLEGFRSIESSPGFNLRDFEQSPASQLQSHRAQPRKALETDDDPFAAANATSSPTATPPSKFQDPTVSVFTNRPRKDSEAVAKSVIEALQRRSKTSVAGSGTPADSATKKVPFDTATLRHIVPYVNGLTHRMKQMLREAEGLQPPVTTRTESPFSHVFAEPVVEESPTLQRHRRITERLDEEDE